MIRPDLVGATVERQLDASLWRLVQGEVGLHDLTPALVGFYSIGFAHGQDSLRPELERAQHDRDTYYERWTNPGQLLTDVRLRRMREAAEEWWQEMAQ